MHATAGQPPIYLHPCAHAPTPPSPQGFASGSLEEDAFAPRMFEQKGLEFAVAQVGGGGGWHHEADCGTHGLHCCPKP